MGTFEKMVRSSKLEPAAQNIDAEVGLDDDRRKRPRQILNHKIVNLESFPFTRWILIKVTSIELITFQ